MKKNSFFLILIVGMLLIFAKRYIYLPTYIVSNPDSEIIFSTEDEVLDQTWQPNIKMIAGIQVPYHAESDFTCDIQLKLFSDDYSEELFTETKEKYIFTAEETGYLDFEFKKVNVTPGERYHIQLSLLNASEEGELKISSGSNYAGCSIAGEEIGQAAALTITFVKYSKLFWLTAVFFPLLGFSLLAMMLTGKKWEETIAFSFFAEGIILYGFGLFEHILLGINMVYILAALSLLWAIYLFNKKDMQLKDLISPGLIIYAVLFVCIIVGSNGDWLGKRDDLRHWGIAVRDMFYYDSFAKHLNTTVLLPRYLPFTAIIEYIFVYMNGLFSEDLLLIAYQTMILSTLIIISKALQKNHGWKQVIPVIIAVVCIPVIFFNEISGSIMVDPLQSAIMAYALICYFSEDNSWFNKIRIYLALIVLTLIKDIGLILAGMTALIILGDIIFRQIQKRKRNIRELAFPVIGVCLALTMYLSWQIYQTAPTENSSKTDYAEEMTEDSGETDAITESTTFQASGITINGLIKVLKGDGEEYQYQVMRNFIIELFDGEMFSIAMIKFSFVDILLLIAFVIVSLGYFGYWGTEKNRMYVFSVLMMLAGICLCLFLLITYWFTFSQAEALALGSMNRYLAPYVCALFLVVCYFIFNKLVQKDYMSVKSQYVMFVTVFILAISMPIEGLVIESKDVKGNTTEEIIYGHEEIAEILRSISKRGEKVQFICSESDGYSEYIFRNAVCPLISEHANWRIVASDEIRSEQYMSHDQLDGEEYKADVVPVEEFENILRNCQYLVLFHVDEGFIKSYAEIFKGNDIEDGSVYKVADDNGKLSLQLIGKTGIKEWR